MGPAAGRHTRQNGRQGQADQRGRRMSGSPVYIDGKLIGAVALRLSVFSPDAICGITPIELMLEINDFDKSRPADARTPDKSGARKEAAMVPSERWAGSRRGGHAQSAGAVADDGADRNSTHILRL